MRSDLLAPADVARLRSEPFSYPEIGATGGPLPPGYAHLHRDVVLGRGAAVFAIARTTLFGWHLHRLAGLRVRSSTLEVRPDTVAIIELALGPIRVHAPVRVVDFIDEPERAGVAYGTLPGHPETGEEAFVVTQAADDSVRFEIVAFSRPASRLAQASGPLGRALQDRATERYLSAMIDSCRPESRAHSR